MCKVVRRNFIPNNQKLLKTQISTIEWTLNCNVLIQWTMYSRKNKPTIASHNNMGKSHDLLMSERS